MYIQQNDSFYRSIDKKYKHGFLHKSVRSIGVVLPFGDFGHSVAEPGPHERLGQRLTAPLPHQPGDLVLLGQQGPQEEVVEREGVEVTGTTAV